jgi:hypothetical protein
VDDFIHIPTLTSELEDLLGELPRAAYLSKIRWILGEITSLYRDAIPADILALAQRTVGDEVRDLADLRERCLSAMQGPQPLTIASLYNLFETYVFDLQEEDSRSSTFYVANVFYPFKDTYDQFGRAGIENPTWISPDGPRGSLLLRLVGEARRPGPSPAPTMLSHP